MRNPRRPRRPNRSANPPEQRPLHVGTDHGEPVLIPPSSHFAPPQRDRGWGAFAEPFIRANEAALAELDVKPTLEAGEEGLRIRLRPGGRAGAVPLCSAQTQRPIGGFVVRPRFGWAGVGRVLHATGWAAAPRLGAFPLVPGSGREVPPWVIAGPVLERLRQLLDSQERGYEEREAILAKPRGRILWDQYRTVSLARGRWHRLPCRYPELDADPKLRRFIRWTLEQVHRSLLAAGYDDLMGRFLATEAAGLLDRLSEVTGQAPSRQQLDELTRNRQVSGTVFRQGLEAMAWTFDERGLGGGRTLDGLAWHLPLAEAWEAYVEAIVREEAARTGGDVRVGRLRETIFPISWSDPVHRSLGHLEPDIVVRHGSRVQIVDAKYKSHLVELDEHGWRRFADDLRGRHRADLHQVLAYASLFEASEVKATLAYPLRWDTWESLSSRGRDRSLAELLHGGRRVLLELRGLPFGQPPGATRALGREDIVSWSPSGPGTGGRSQLS